MYTDDGKVSDINTGEDVIIDALLNGQFYSHTGKLIEYPETDPTPK